MTYSAQTHVKAGLLVGLFCMAAVIGGCSSGSSTGGDPGARPLPGGQTCQNIQGELNKLISRGVQGSVEAQSAGRKLSPAQKVDADRYNQLLAQYLGARCHV